MSLPPWMLGVILVAFAGIPVVWFLKVWLDRRDAKRAVKPIPGSLIPAGYLGEANATALGLAFNNALERIATLGPWPRERLFAALIPVSPVVAVQATFTWKNVAGEQVGGETVGNVMRVGPDWGSLCHEAAHLAELAVTGTTDDGRLPGSLKHPSWVVNGLDQADQAYRSWLKVQPKA